MGQLRSAIRALAGQAGSPSELLGALRRSWELLGFDRIATALVGTVDRRSGRVCLASAGHYPPLLVGEDGARYLDVTPTPPLGVESAAAVETQFTLHEGPVLVCYTDGAIDERVIGSEASMQRLAAVAAGEGAVRPGPVLDRVVAMLDPKRLDDVALVAFQRR
jgi:serine/threonine-protein kinase RsbW